MTLFSKPVLFLDTETTGLPHDPLSEVVELAAVILNEDGEEVSTFSTLIQPTNGFSHRSALRSMKITGLKEEDFVDAPPQEQVRELFLGWYEENGSPHSTAYNVRFDRQMLSRGLDISGSITWCNCVMKRMCGLKMMRHCSLQQACNIFGIELDSSSQHRALYDARLASLVAKAIRSAETGRL